MTPEDARSRGASRTSLRCSPTRSSASSSTTTRRDHRPHHRPHLADRKGQRGLIVSPPKAGKTTIIKQIVYSIERNNPECT
jgi:hypothetical protein